MSYPSLLGIRVAQRLRDARELLLVEMGQPLSRPSHTSEKAVSLVTRVSCQSQAGLRKVGLDQCPCLRP